MPYKVRIHITGNLFDLLRNAFVFLRISMEIFNHLTVFADCDIKGQNFFHIHKKGHIIIATACSYLIETYRV